MEFRAEQDYALSTQRFSLFSELDSLNTDSKALRFADDAHSRHKMEQFRQFQHVHTSTISSGLAIAIHNGFY
jgi:hypothetical protein